MAETPQTPDETRTPARQLTDAMAQLQSAGFGSMMGMGTAWVETLSDMSAEMLGFVADRIKEDVKTQHQILHCKDAAELQHIQAQFLQKAFDQYQIETCKLVAMGNKGLGTDNAD